MKKIFALALITLLIGGIAFAGPTGPDEAGDILGQGKYPGQAHRVFRLVHVNPQCNDSDGLVAGTVVVWDDLLDDGVTVETTTTSGDSRVAGVLASTVVSNDTDGVDNNTASDDAGLTANWGWMQTYGLNDDVLADTVAIATGTAVCAGATAGRISEIIIGTATTNAGILGCALTTTTTSGAAQKIIITRD